MIEELFTNEVNNFANFIINHQFYKELDFNTVNYLGQNQTFNYFWNYLWNLEYYVFPAHQEIKNNHLNSKIFIITCQIILKQVLS